MFSMKRIFRPSPAATDPSPEKLPVEPPEIVTLRAMSTDRALRRVANRDLEIGTVIDIGASDGRWSGVCAKHYPDAHYLLIEVQDLHEEALKAYVSAHPRLNISATREVPWTRSSFTNRTGPFWHGASLPDLQDPRPKRSCAACGASSIKIIALGLKMPLPERS